MASDTRMSQYEVNVLTRDAEKIHLLSRNLYYRRFFPYYTGAILAGIDENGKGAVFSYDPIGCIERLTYSASGSAEPMMMPFFDCQAMTLSSDVEKPRLTIERAKSLMKDAFRVASEREISTGDKIHIVIAEAGKPLRKMFLPLRED
ncbi:unnamed protein product [Gongylonema pulchrum]|uniref:Proteasome endopeptidase complex n=1 Tax=Gongylonema pulchrum TaxID=637853 RepID=A0A183DY19_9BILA|nr:unnamed protein product [Gongylonema pulchrum]VDN27916.1 unnamed protein product [Gongylonema pulchrum]